MTFRLPRPIPRGAFALLLAFALSSLCFAAELGVSELRYAPGSSTTIVWKPAPDADGYGIHRGGIGSRGFSSYDHVCLATEIPEALAVDDAVPEPGQAFYYLATGLMHEQGGHVATGDLGVDGEGVARPSGPFKCAVRVFVDPDATGANDGSSWEDAYTTLAAALTHWPWSEGSTTIWMTGTVVESDLLIDVPDPRILGGFAGDETRTWQRDPSAHPSRWSGGGGTPLVVLDVGGMRLLVDGVVMSDVGTAIIAWGAGTGVDVRNSRFERVGRGVSIESWGGHPSRVSITSTSFADGPTTALRALSYEGSVEVRMRHVRLDAVDAPGIELRAMPQNMWPSRIDAEIVACTIHGGDPAIRIEAESRDDGGMAVEGVADVTIASTFVLDALGDGIVFEALGNADLARPWPIEASAIGRVVGCTIDAPGGSALVSRASRRSTSGSHELLPVRAAPEVWDSLFTGAGLYGVLEGPDDEAASVWSDVVLVGANLHGAGTLYLDEGFEGLTTIAEVNALDGCRDNVDESPGYRLSGVDRHLAPDSPSIDQGHHDAPNASPVDVDGQARRYGPSRDRGADEHRPLP